MAEYTIPDYWNLLDGIRPQEHGKKYTNQPVLQCCSVATLQRQPDQNRAGFC